MNTCERCKKQHNSVSYLCDDCWHEIEAEQHEMKLADGYYDKERLHRLENPNAICPNCGDEYHTSIGHLCSE